MAIQFEKRVSLGNVLEIIVIVVAIISAYFNLTNVQTKMQAQIDFNYKEFNEVRSSLIYYLRSDLKLVQDEVVKNKLDDIIKRLDRVERKQ